MTDDEFQQACLDLANAALEGSKERKQITRTFWESNSDGTVTGVCFLGAAYLARIGYQPLGPSYSSVKEAFPVLRELVYWPDRELVSALSTIIPALNDQIPGVWGYVEKRWSISEIAEYVRSCQRKNVRGEGE